MVFCDNIIQVSHWGQAKCYELEHWWGRRSRSQHTSLGPADMRDIRSISSKHAKRRHGSRTVPVAEGTTVSLTAFLPLPTVLYIIRTSIIPNWRITSVFLISAQQTILTLLHVEFNQAYLQFFTEPLTTDDTSYLTVFRSKSYDLASENGRSNAAKLIITLCEFLAICQMKEGEESEG